MDKDDLKYLIHENTKESKEKELKDLERLAEKFGEKGKKIFIDRNCVYDYSNNKKVYLMSYAEYSRYKKLIRKYKKPTKSEDESDKAYKSFLESSKSHNV